jgi:hypothetical protein
MILCGDDTERPADARADVLRRVVLGFAKASSHQN